MLLILKKIGLRDRVYVVHDGAQALDFLFGTGKYEHKVKAVSLKFVLLDLKLPKLDGFEVLEKIRQNKDFDAVPVVIHSSSAVPADITKAYLLGANSYLVKPIDFKEHTKSITETVNYWLNVNQTLV